MNNFLFFIDKHTLHLDWCVSLEILMSTLSLCTWDVPSSSRHWWVSVFLIQALICAHFVIHAIHVDHMVLFEALISAQFVIADIDECAGDNICPDSCVNTYGDFYCHCQQGTRLARNGLCVGELKYVLKCNTNEYCYFNLKVYANDLH